MTKDENTKLTPVPWCQNCRSFKFWDEVYGINRGYVDLGHCVVKDMFSGTEHMNGLVAGNFCCNSYEQVEEG